MKKMLTTALAFTAMATAAFAQETVPTVPIERQATPLVGATQSIRQPAPGQEHSSVSTESDYSWSFNMFRRFGPQFDTNRSDLTVPLDFGNGVEMRGFGQVFDPKVFYPYFNGIVYNSESGHITPSGNITNDQDYIDQFKNAGAYTITDILFPVFRNPHNTPANPGLITIYKTSYNFQSSNYKTRGFQSGRQALAKLQELEISQDKGLDTTIGVTDAGDSVVNSTHLDFNGNPESISAPLELKANESVIVLYTNEFQEAIVGSIGADDTREWQRAIATNEYATGSYVPDPDHPGQSLDQRANPLDSFKTFGLVMFRQGGKDSIYSAWAALVFISSNGDTNRAISNIDMSFFGTIDLASGGVKYHFGKDASSQGLGAVTPNPAREKSEIAFSLLNHENVRIDLYNVKGELVKNLVDARYVQGNYSVPLGTEDLTSGVYLVRMIAGDQIYTQKVTVSK